MAFDGTLKFDTAIDKTGFQLGLGSLGSIAQKGMALVTGAVTAAAGTVSALGKKAVDVGTGFESGMAKVIATMGVTKDTVVDGVNSYDLLKQAAADAGESTTFSASEAADALNYLALAGYSAAQASEALPSVLDLAAAGGLDLAYASDLATDAMSALGIEATKESLTHFGDEMAKTASKANTSVAQLGEAILTVGGTAKSLAGGTTELNAALGVLANRGIKGSEGGTALRNMILSLSAPTDKAAAQLETLGVEVFDATGKMRPLNEVFKDLDKSLSTMNDGEKTQVLNSIFNKVDLKSAQAMLAGCGDEFDSLTAELQSCDGAMHDMAETMNDTLEGDMKSLGSKAEALGIAVYDSLNDPLRELAQLGGKYISQLTAAFKDGGFDGLASALGDVLGQAVTKLSSYIPKLTQLGVSLVSSLVKGLKKNVPAITSAALEAGLTLIEGIFSIGGDLLDLGASLLVSLADGITERLPEITQTAQTIITNLTQSIVTNLPLIITAGIDIITALADALSENIDLMISAALTVIQTLCESLLNGENLQKLLDAGLNLLMSLTQAIVDNLPLLIDIAIQILTFLCTELLSADNLMKLVDAAFQIVTALVDAIIDNIDELLLAVEEIITTLCDTLTEPGNLERMLKTGAELLGKIVAGLFQIAGKLFDFGAMLFEDIDEATADIDWGSIGTAIVEGICSGLLDCDFVLSDFLADFKENWVSGFKDIFGIHSPSKLMHDEIGEYLALGIGEGFADEAAGIGQSITQTVSGWTAGLAKDVQSAAQRVTQGAAGVFGKLPAEVQKPLAEAGNALKTWGASAAEIGKNAGKTFLDGTQKFLSLLPGDTGEQLTATLKETVSWGNDLVRTGRDSAQEFLTRTIDFVKRLPNMTQDELSDTLSRVVSWGASLVQRGRDAAQSLVSAIVDTVSSLPETMANIGANLVSGLWNGITNMGGWLRDQITGFAGGIIDGFKDTFGIASPSKVMRDAVGKYLAQGIGVGFTAEIPNVGKDALKAFSDIQLPDFPSPKYNPQPVPQIDSGAVQALRQPNLFVPTVEPSATNTIVNNSYTYNTNNNTTNITSDSRPTQHAPTIVRIEMDGDVIAEKLVDRVDTAQGEAVTFDERGTAH